MAIQFTFLLAVSQLDHIVCKNIGVFIGVYSAWKRARINIVRSSFNYERTPS